MSLLKKNRGIVLRTTKYSESDLIVQMILISGEKVSLLARGAVKSKKRFGGGVLEPTHYIEIMFRPGQGEKLSVLQEATMLDAFPGLRTDYEKLEIAFFCLTTIGKISQEGDGHSEGLFNLLGHALRELQEAKNFDIFKTAFTLKALHQQGVLEIEPWMSPFLKSSLAQVVSNENNIPLNKVQAAGLQSQLTHYLQTAGTHYSSF